VGLTRISLRAPQGQEWDAISRLVAEAIPHYLVSHLGTRFGSLYYRHLASHPGTCGLAAYDAAGSLAGFVLGTLDSCAARRLTTPVIARLLLAANVKLLSPAFLRWLARGVPSILRTGSPALEFPEAELILLVVSPTFRGQKLAPRLLTALEEFFRQRQHRAPYFILTEKTNLASNRFYEKVGARLVRTNHHHGREINEWHKSFA
jgi:ribosomal protein S18 acetylase RimI-like enzyme